MSSPRIDILVTTYQRASDLLVLMKNLEDQQYKNFKLQIFDGSMDEEVSNAVKTYLAGNRKYEYPIIFHTTVAGMTRQRNIAVDNTVGEISVFLDDDVELETDYLEQMVAVFDSDEKIAGMNGFDTNALVVSKGKKLGRRKRLYRKMGLLPDWGPARYLPWGHGTPHFTDSYRVGYTDVDLLIGHNMAFRTDLLKEYRFADFFEDYPTYVLYDDQDICLRLRKKYRLVLSYEAKLKHKISPSGRPPQLHYGFQAFFNAYRNWKLFGGTDWKTRLKFWLWESLDIIFLLPSAKTRNISLGRLIAVGYVIRGYKRFKDIKRKVG